MAEWLHGQLETYRLPQSLVEEGAPRRLAPIFKDRDELPVTDDLGDAIKTALANSDALIVLCSPHSAISPWIGREIDIFKRIHGDKNVYPVVVDGDPPHNVPLPLRTHYEDGAPTEEMAEPVAADFRPEGDGKKLGLMKLIAGLADVQLDALVDREAARKHRRMMIVAGLSILGMVIAVGLAVFAIQQRDAARDERAEANGLIEYMLTDLRDELEPVGRLDVLDGVGTRAMEYYARQNLDNLSPDELGRRAKAVQLVAEVHNLRGDNDKALPAFREAARTTGELLARRPDDPERMYNHGQSLFWVGYIAWQRGQLDEAKDRLGDYADISTRLAALDRDNLDWQMEEGYAFSNLGTLAHDEGRNEEALELFKRSEAIVERVAIAEDRPVARLIEWGESLSWVARVENRLGNFSASGEALEREIALYDEVLGADPANVDALRPHMLAQANLAGVLAMTGNKRQSMAVLDEAVDTANRLIDIDPDNSWTIEMARSAIFQRAALHWSEGRSAAASMDYDRAAQLLADLRSRDAQNKAWNVDLLAEIELMRMLGDRASMPADEMARIATSWVDRLDDGDADHAALLAAAHIIRAVAERRQGNQAAAAAAYARAVAVESDASGVDTNLMALRALAAERLGQDALASDIRARFRELGVDPLIDDRVAGG